ncbi:hypothetical protein F4V57_07485 [Acinetobacter qingfengensis]|uniref:hypothetical protein n=1 Tax=Acinetobacter qingfengensis TaxID=1262585 RepID=UPI00114C8C45|nr:hypothetical protein [Acinetobacter qingfengensis]KAA8733883.1 hypothetical protein F4V57_07485 [Acinetobacter qingfengensis]
MSYLNALIAVIPTLYDPFALKIMLTVLAMAFVMLFVCFWISRNFLHALIASISVTTLATFISLALASALSRG